MPPSRAKVHLLDVGTKKYGDCTLLELGQETVLIDGAHDNDTEAIASQIDLILKEPNRISLLIITHGHADHIGCIPELVANDSIEVEWALIPDPDIAFGRTPGSDYLPPSDESPAQERARTLAQALREEDRSDVPEDELQEFLDAAATQEQRYRDFIKLLEEKDVEVVLYGSDDPSGLIDRFATIGMDIIGPSQSQIDSAAEVIRIAVDSTMRMSADALGRDEAADLVETYRLLARGLTDAGKDRPGAAINMTSIVTYFEIDGRNFLLGGDMEFEKPSPATPAIKEGVAAMRSDIQKRAPFDFYKLCHHGSWNGFGEKVLSDLGDTRYLGISTGVNSPSHPAKASLDLLRQSSDELVWARTDRNGRTTFTYSTNVRVTPSRGKLNNSTMNKQDALEAEGTALVRPAEPVSLARSSPQLPASGSLEGPAASCDFVEVTAKVPHTRTRVTITIDVEPPAGDARRDRAAGSPQAASGGETVSVARAVNGLLFVTSREGLANNIGSTAVHSALEDLRAKGAHVLDTLPAGLIHSGQVAPLVREELVRTRAKGVVLLGGYDVVPPQSLDCLPAELRARMNGSGDPDNFIVWSDDIYGDREGDELPEVPVSRIPDGRSARLVAAALAPPPPLRGSAAVRNIARPFADTIYAGLPGGRKMIESQPAVFSSPQYSLDTDYVYLMLHGEYSDGSRFWGEETDGDLEAVNISNIPSATGAVVFTGCCWGALTVDKPAGRLVPGQSLGTKTPDGSIALAFLERGARAFVGCTGAHYSPLDEPYDYFGGPLHKSFWSEVLAGTAPAQALFNAKKAYVTGMPHGQTSAAGRAVEFKIFRQFTCLGLGW